MAQSIASDLSMLRQFPYPYRHVVTFDSDVDRQEPWHGAAIHRLLNERLGLNVSDSCWVMAARARQSSFFVGADLNVRHVPEEENHIAWRLLLREWHRGNIDHFHSWYDDGTYLLRYPQTGEDVVVPPPPASVGGAVYRVLRLIVKSQERRDAISGVTLETDTGAEIAYAVSADQRASRILGEAGRVVPTIELILGMDRPLSGDAPRNWTAVRRIRIDGGDVEAVELDNMSRRLLVAQAMMMERLNVRPVYVSSHGGRTCVQNFGEIQLETKGRFDEHDPAVVRERIPQADNPGSHGFYADLLARLGTEIIWPQMWGRFREFSHDMACDAPSIKTWGSNMAGGWRTHVTPSLTHLLDAKSFSEAMAAYVPGGDIGAIAELYSDFHESSGLSGKRVVTGHGSAIPFLLYSSLSMAQTGCTAEHLWYTHFGSHRDNRLDEITPDQPFTQFCTRYWQELASYAHGAVEKERVWSPSAGTYFRYKMATQFLHDAVSVEGSRVSIGTRQVEATGRTIPDLRAGTRDLHGLTIFVEDAGEASLTVDGVEVSCFSRNAADETGHESITVLDNHCPTPLLDRIPASESGTVEVADAGFADLPAPGAHGFVLTATGPAPHLRVAPHCLHLWNTTHLAMRYMIEGGGRLKVVLTVEGRPPVVISEVPPAPEEAGSFWTLRPGAGWQEHWLPVASLKMYGEPAEGEAFPVPVGKVKAIEVSLIEASPGSRLELEWIRGFRACANAISPDGHLILGGRVSGPEGPVARAGIVARDLAGQEWNAVSDRYGYWLLDNMPEGAILELSCAVGGSSYRSNAGRYIDLRKNEVEVDFLVKQ